MVSDVDGRQQQQQRLLRHPPQGRLGAGRFLTSRTGLLLTVGLLLVAGQRVLFSDMKSKESKPLTTTGVEENKKSRPLESSPPILDEYLGRACRFSDPFSARLTTTDELTTKEGNAIVNALGESPRNHRKQWEFVAIVRALKAAKMLQPGKRGLVFAAGSEPLISYFASKGADILATDMDYSGALANGWVTTNQHATSRDALFLPNIISRKDFDQRVSYATADMNQLNETWFGTFDFVWTTCSVEHVGSIEKGMKFGRDSMKLLKPNGLAIHTTEFLLSSLDETVTEGSTVYWRRKDMEELLESLKSDGHRPSTSLCLKTGIKDEKDYDVEPFRSSNHIRLLVGKYVLTSVVWTAWRNAVDK